jgi:hypothetical protein
MIGVTQRSFETGRSKIISLNWKGFVCGDRSYRRFHLKDIELARLIKKYLDEGFRLQAAAERARADMGGVK